MQLVDPRWRCSPGCGIALRGTAFADGALCSTPEEMDARLPPAQADAGDWGSAIGALNGFFSLIRCAEGRLVAAVDRVRSLPLFYGGKSGTVFISDDAEWLRQQVGDVAMEPVARDEFQLAGYVTGSDTLYPNVRQLQAGELLVVDAAQDEARLVAWRYYRFLHREPQAWDERLLLQGLEQVALASMKRLADYARGRQVVIPLSGGYDSRLIATLLSELGHDNILTFSYGIRGNKESAYSREVARALGLEWRFVEYSKERWRSAWNTDQRRRYQKWASGWASLPHVQDWVAVRDLHASGAIDRNCVFVPGHSGDFVAGSHIPDLAFGDAPVDTDTLVEEILRKHYSRSAGKYGPRAGHAQWRTRVLDRTQAADISSCMQFADAFEKWDWQERQSKFVVNAVRVYEFFGYDWWLPLWDAEFMVFWQGVPLALRRKRHWYLEYVKRVYASRIAGDNGKPLSNASDPGLLGRTARSTAGMLPASARQWLKGLRDAVVPTALPGRVTNAYSLSHFPASELRRLRGEGYRPDGMTVHEFLTLVSQPGVQPGNRECEP